MADAHIIEETCFCELVMVFHLKSYSAVGRCGRQQLFPNGQPSSEVEDHEDALPTFCFETTSTERFQNLAHLMRDTAPWRPAWRRLAFFRRIMSGTRRGRLQSLTATWFQRRKCTIPKTWLSYGPTSKRSKGHFGVPVPSTLKPLVRV